MITTLIYLSPPSCENSWLSIFVVSPLLVIENPQRIFQHDTVLMCFHSLEFFFPEDFLAIPNAHIWLGFSDPQRSGQGNWIHAK